MTALLFILGVPNISAIMIQFCYSPVETRRGEGWGGITMRGGTHGGECAHRGGGDRSKKKNPKLATVSFSKRLRLSQSI